MSTLRVSNLQNNSGSGTISVPTGNKLTSADAGAIYTSGQIIQCKYVRTDNRSAISSISSGNGTRISDLSLTITPKNANSLLIMQWMINGELHQDNVFLIHKNSALITTAGSEGYNNSSGNSRWSGIASGFYDQNESSTPSNWVIQYSILAGSTESATYAPAVRGSNASDYTFYMNRTYGSTGQDAYETMVSTGMIMEVLP
jgi:hypothetical protein